jgi:hypothetical protein
VAGKEGLLTPAGDLGRPYAQLLTATCAVVAFALVSCSAGPRPQSATVAPPEPPPTVYVEMLDYRFDYDANIPSGRVVFQIVNAGDVPHQLTLFPLPDELPPIEEQLLGSERRYVDPFAGIYERAPGDTGTFAVDLEPDRRYAMVCYVVAPDGQPHFVKGMASEFRTPSVSGGRS